MVLVFGVEIRTLSVGELTTSSVCANGVDSYCAYVLGVFELGRLLVVGIAEPSVFRSFVFVGVFVGGVVNVWVFLLLIWSVLVISVFVLDR